MTSATVAKIAADGSDSPRDFEPFLFFMLAVAQKKQEKREWTAEDRANYRHREGLKMAKLLEKSAEKIHSPRGLAVADCIRETASPANIYFSSEQINFQTGELFDGFGVLTEAVSSRLCPSYQARMSKRARKMAREAIARVGPTAPDERLRFLTLTMPNLRVGFKMTLDVLDTAIVLLKKRVWFKKNVRGAIQAIETTIKDPNHFHFHAHILAVSKWINWKQLGEQWTDCVKKACQKHDVFCNYETSHERLIVDVRLVVSKSNNPRQTIGFEDAIQETCKYLVKGSDFENVPVEKLCEIERTLRGRKMIRTFGECANPSSVIGENTDFSSADTHLNTIDTTDAYEPSKRQKLKLETLVETGARLIMSGRRDEWLLLLRRKMRERRDFRRKQLLEMYPGAVFWTLDGKSFRNYAENCVIPPDVVGNVVSIADYKLRMG